MNRIGPVRSAFGSMRIIEPTVTNLVSVARLPFAFAVLILINGCSAHEYIPSSSLDGLQIYVIPGGGAWSDATKETAKCPQLDPSEMRRLLQNARYQRRTPTHKAGWYGELTLTDGRVVPAYVSQYGGFFEIEGQSGAYVIEGTDRANWDALIDRMLNAVRGEPSGRSAVSQPSPAP